MSSLRGLVDEVDVQIERIQRLIDAGAVLDPELGAGLGTTQSISGLQKDIDGAAVACEALDTHIRTLSR
ncbi:hypothetical protein AB0C44_33425 [Micromonospora taraxaci]|uniref:hypothetical protein n=1 Tax=Micromonospora taraxaci TaxID=1316803 RepID=UPI0033C60BF7